MRHTGSTNFCHESTSTRVRHRRSANASGYAHTRQSLKKRAPAKENRLVSSLLGYDVIARCSRGGRQRRDAPGGDRRVGDR